MIRRPVAIPLALFLLLILALWSTSIALGEPGIQGDPTAQQQTIDAAVNQFFTQTAQANNQINMTQTIEAAFNQALTATAGFEGTVSAQFDQALTATAIAPMQASAAQKGLAIISRENAQQIVQVTEFLEDDHDAYAVAFNPDATILAFGDSYGDVWLKDVKTGSDLGGVHDEHDSTIYALAFSPDGSTVAFTVDYQNVHLLDIASGATRPLIEQDMGDIQDLAFSPDGATLLAAATYSVRLWDVVTGNTIRDLTGDDEDDLDVYSMALSPDGRLAAVGGEWWVTDDWIDAVRLYDVATGELVRQLPITPTEDSDSPPIDLAFSPGGATLAVAPEDGPALLIDVETGRQIAELEGYYILSVAFSPDGVIAATGDEEGTIRLWDATTGVALVMLEADDYYVSDLVFSPDGSLLASASDSGIVRLWGVRLQASPPPPSGQ
ncbi:MAG: WD40 repeat domain-containing protein [Anaerolineae bacterium]|nr:WD40 repeat domain-containing protein [Anaerolineae bacterium]